MTTGGAARTWRAEWTAPSGHPVWTDFATEAQAELFALRRVGAVVDIRAPLEPVLDALPRVDLVDLSSEESVDPDPEAFAAVVEGAPARTSVERRLVDVVSGLRRSVAPAPSAEFVRGLRCRLVGC